MPTLAYTTVAYGRSSVVRADLRTALGRDLYAGYAQDVDIMLTQRLLREGDAFVDGGANVGLFTIVAAEAVGPSGAVFAFEPAPATAEALRLNVRLSHLDWVRVEESALGRAGGAREFTAFAGDGAGLSSFEPTPSVKGGLRLRVPVVALDAYLRDTDKRRLRLLKLDVEGADLEALRGAEILLREYGPDVIVEIEDEHLRRHGTSAIALEGYLRALGYDLLVVKRNGDALTASPFVMSNRSLRPNVFATRRLQELSSHGVLLAHEGGRLT